MSHPLLECRHLYKSYQGKPVVADLSLNLAAGEILAVVGPSGCGKTTTLRLIAGFERPERGEIHMGGKPLVAAGVFIPPEKRGIGMVFQDYALFPHLNVYENIAFGLKGWSKTQVQRRVNELLALVGLQGMARRFPHQLSGGEQQRVALARALAPQPQVLLLDEPFSNLDADLRLKLREEVRTVLKGLNLAALFVTHDQEEALFMGDRLAVMNQGRVHQIGTPEAIFARPVNRFVAEFMGNAYFLPGHVTRQGIQTELGLVRQEVPYPPGSRVDVAVRADDIGLDLQGPPNGKVVGRVFKGLLNLYQVELRSGCVLPSLQPHDYFLPPGQPVHVYLSAQHELACFATESDTSEVVVALPVMQEET
ncbi:ABC transporter ATP-binding protein [uncultured Thermanaerothrix sp.]|uniref:ABC transporter ATP-binding protein n=1 Tax=uncultured Thermanaerothrix sp. TaxID=1195149 RepID=UPI0026186DEF|nr:ABC transporter ATP-binding protein [uncultured Thermanaerothrix sp.]